MKIGITSDHRGYELKEIIKREMTKLNYQIKDYGTNSKESTDYPDYAFKLGESVSKKELDYGIAICGSGIGISIACNKVKGVRCAKVNNYKEAVVTRIDNNANIIALSETISKRKALKIIKKFIDTPFSNTEKHQRRINKIIAYEKR